MLFQVAAVLLCSTVGPTEPPRETWGSVPKFADLEPRGVLPIYEWRLRQLEQDLRRAGGTGKEDEKVSQLLSRYAQVMHRVLLLRRSNPYRGAWMLSVTPDQMLELRGKLPLPKPPIRD